MTTSIVSPNALNRPDRLARASGAMRVIAKAKMVVKTISGRTVVSAAAAIGLAGIRPRMKSEKVGEGGASVAPPSPLRNAAAAPCDSGNRRSNSGVTSSDIRPVRKIDTMKMPTDRAASVPRARRLRSQ